MARAMLDEKVELVEINYFDSWIRDMAPFYVINKAGQCRAVNFQFNGWGMKNMPIMNQPDFKWDYKVDNEVSMLLTKNRTVDYYQVPMVLEGGSIHVDGEGTLYTTEECLLNPNRNPDLTKKQVEEYLQQYLNVKKVIWIPRGVYNDETSGHIDNLMHIVAPGHVILTWTDDQNDPQYERSSEALTVLENTLDAKGRKIKVTKLHQPLPVYIKAPDIANREYSPRFMTRVAGFRMPASYANFDIINGAIVVPTFDDPIWDQKAIKILQECFPNREIIGINTREVLLGGGNIHCITQQEL